MDVWRIEVKHGTLFPRDEPGAIGLLFGIDEDDGERITVVVDPDWLRLLMDAMDAGADVKDMKIPEEVMLPIAGRGWDDDWGEEERTEMTHMHWLFREADRDWQRLRGAVDVLTGFRQ